MSDKHVADNPVSIPPQQNGASTHTPEFLSQVIGHIYQAASDASLWPLALAETVRFVGNSGAHLWLMDNQTGLASHSVHVGMPDDLMREYNGEVIKDCPRYENARANPDQILLYDYQHIEEREIDSNEYYHWLQTTGDSIRYYLGGRIRTAAGVEGFQSMAFRKSEGHAQREHIERFSMILPHVQRAIQIGQQLGTWKFLSESAAEVFDRLTHGVILLDNKQHVLKLNLCAEQLLKPPSPLSLRQGTLSVREPGLQRELQRLIAQCVATSLADGRSTGGLLKLPRIADGSVIHALVCPMKTAPGALDVHQPAAVVFLHDPGAQIQFDQQAIRSGFGLTAAECRLATLLLSGLSLAQISTQLGLSTNTVRGQLKSIFAKTGVKRQTDLLRALLPFCRPGDAD